MVVRSLIEAGERATDALGELVARDEESVTVRTRRGEVRVELALVVAAKQVPASPAGVWRVAPFLRRGEVVVLGEGTLRTVDGPVPATVSLVEELRAAGTPVFTLGQHRTPALPHLGGPGEPTVEMLALAHDEIEDRLGRRVGRARVHCTDARPDAVDAARVVGWQGRVFTPPPATREG